MRHISLSLSLLHTCCLAAVHALKFLINETKRNELRLKSKTWPKLRCYFSTAIR